MRSHTRPGVPTTMVGFSAASSLTWSALGMPPKSTAVLTEGMYLEKREYSLPIW